MRKVFGFCVVAMMMCSGMAHAEKVQRNDHIKFQKVEHSVSAPQTQIRRNDRVQFVQVNPFTDRQMTRERVQRSDRIVFTRVIKS